MQSKFVDMVMGLLGGALIVLVTCFSFTLQLIAIVLPVLVLVALMAAALKWSLTFLGWV